MEEDEVVLRSDSLGLLRGALQRYRFWVAQAIYAGVTSASLALAVLLRFEFQVPSVQFAGALQALPLLLVARFAAHGWWGLASVRWRFVGTTEVVRLGGSILTGSFLSALVIALLPGLTLPRSIFLIEAVVTTLVMAGCWVSYRLWFESRRRSMGKKSHRPRRVLIVGAGDSGNLLAREMGRASHGYRVVGFVDDDPFKWGTRIQGVEVIGGGADLAAIAAAVRAEEIIISIPSAEPNELRHIVENCESLDIPFKVLPGIREVLEGDVRPGRLRELRIEDLLGREPISLELPSLGEDLHGKVALVTGAAGSIGSELARQVAANRPAELILLDQAESDLFFIERELRESYPEMRLTPIVGDILDRSLLEALFRGRGIGRVYHAAAYKHVPLMETNVRSAVLNNVLGTWRVAEVAGRSGVEKFVLISTDKAVRPSNVMGVTKRIAEIVVTSCQERFAATEFMAVRFGNVLGSAGSVVPIFERQLAAGKPLTVTDPEVTRYFMTIAEAVQLVLQASLLPDAAGKVAMLDMGEPVRIVELARSMIRLQGKRPDIDVPIHFTGLRPGEKLHEELAAPDERTVETSISRVRLITPPVRDDRGHRAGKLLDIVLSEVESWVDPGVFDTDELRRSRLELLLATLDQPAARAKVEISA